jgi:hypothetical protein
VNPLEEDSPTIVAPFGLTTASSGPVAIPMLDNKLPATRSVIPPRHSNDHGQWRLVKLPGPSSRSQRRWVHGLMVAASYSPSLLFLPIGWRHGRRLKPRGYCLGYIRAKNELEVLYRGSSRRCNESLKKRRQIRVVRAVYWHCRERKPQHTRAHIVVRCGTCARWARIAAKKLGLRAWGVRRTSGV